MKFRRAAVKLGVTLVVALATLRGAGPALANPLLETLGGLGATNPLTARLMAQGAEAAYFAPALLPYIDEGFDVGFFLVSDQLDVGFGQRPAGADVPDDVYHAWAPDAHGELQPLTFRPLPTAKLATRGDRDRGPLRSYLSIGLVKKLLKKRLAFAFEAILPTATFQEQTARFSDEREQFFTNKLGHELYGDRLGMMTMVLGLGGEILDWLSWGAGFTLGLSTTTVNPVYVPDAANQREILITTDTAVDTTLAPHLSLAFRPSDNITIGASFHFASKSKTTGTNRLKFWKYDYEEGEDALIQRFTFVNGYDPMTVGAGAHIAFPVDAEHSWDIGAELRWRAWSDYIDRVGEHPQMPWSDTFSVAVGGRYRTGAVTIHLDAAWVPTPVPDQTGPENYVDEDRLGFAAGMKADFDLFDIKLHGMIGVQVHRLLPRSQKKNSATIRDEFPDGSVDPVTQLTFPSAVGLQTNNPGYPGFSGEGWLLGAGVSLGVDL